MNKVWTLFLLNICTKIDRNLPSSDSETQETEPRWRVQDTIHILLQLEHSTSGKIKPGFIVE